MTVRALVVQLLLAMAVIALANLGIQKLAANSNPRQLLRRGERAEHATDLFLGNSTMAAGLDEAAFAESCPESRPLNMALGATAPVEHFLIYSRQDKHRPVTVYYGFLDTQLTDLPNGGWETLVGNRAMAYYVDLDSALKFYAADSCIKDASLRFVAKFPMLVERYTAWSKVEILRRTFGEVGLVKKETNRFGRAEDFSLLEDDPKEFAGRCQRVTALCTPLSPPVSAIIQKAKGNGASITVVEMPVTEQHRSRFYSSPDWENYRTHLIQLVHDTGATYLSASDWIGEDGFSDHLHLSRSGAKTFSLRLGQTLQRKR